MAVISRRRLAKQFAADLEGGTKYEIMVKRLAAYLIEKRQQKQLEQYVGDIEAELAKNGSVIADVVSAKTLDDTSRMRAQEYAAKVSGSTHVTLREHIDESLIGGIIVRVNGLELDASVRSQLRQLRMQ